MNLPPSIPAYVIHYCAPEWCRSTVASLRAASLRVRVHVVDNGGLEMSDDIEGATILRQPDNRGFTGAANVALGHWLTTRTDEFCLITSHDLNLDPSAVDRLVAFAMDHPRAGVLAPRLTGTGRGHLRHYAKAFERADPRAVAPRLRPPLPGGLRSAWVSGSCLLLRRTCVEDVGPFDERFGSYCEDVDYCVRANVAGWDVVVVEQAGGSTRGSASSGANRYMWSNWVLTGAKHLGFLAACGRLLQGVRRIGVAIARGVAHPSRARETTRVVVDSCLAIGKGVTLLGGWYVHVVASRLRDQPPESAVCSEATLLDALEAGRRERDDRGGAGSAPTFGAAPGPSLDAHRNPSLEGRGGQA